MSTVKRTSQLERRMSIPAGLEDLEDCTVAPDDVIISPLTSNDPSLVLLRENFVKFPKEVRNLLAGGIAGMVAKSVVAPVDRIKILYQVSSKEFHWHKMPSVVRNIVHNEGFTALWKGNAATMIRVFPYSGIQFMVYDRCKMYCLAQHQEQQDSSDGNNTSFNKHGLTPLESLTAGMIAGTTSVICTYPLDLTRAQLAVLKKHKRSEHVVNIGFIGVLKQNYANRGVAGLFRGIAPTLLGILPYSGIAFALNEQGKREIQHVTGRDVTTVERMQCGAISGLVAQSVTYPIEVTRRRMQTIGLVVGNDNALGNLGDGRTIPTNTAKMAPSPPGMFTIMRDLYQEQGVRGFFKGVSMNWLKGPIAFSISFTVFDTVQALIESDSERKMRLPMSVRNDQQRQ